MHFSEPKKVFYNLDDINNSRNPLTYRVISSITELEIVNNNINKIIRMEIISDSKTVRSIFKVYFLPISPLSLSLSYLYLL